jgi:hypothetical protein
MQICSVIFRNWLKQDSNVNSMYAAREAEHDDEGAGRQVDKHLLGQVHHQRPWKQVQLR